ncbi:flagellar motor protein MotD [Betaproteobacteria bacterium]|nr:flagellar motor protein MotD [Betaproteobacteria bacterium]GHU48942.1 flagellar motor protein MotD [Betaproteobacteria bacterium]
MARRLRKKRLEEHENLDRWLVSYADFITLLFAFFVVMYALSSINEGKYRVLSDSLNSAFRNLPEGQLALPPGSPPLPIIVPVPRPREAEEVKGRQRDKMRNMAKDIMQALAPLVRAGKVRVLETSRGVTVEINDSVLFAPGQARLEPLSVSALEAVGEVLAQSEFPITIEGHTDNVPIHTPQFPSNWELSAVRATTVLRLFAEVGVPQEHLTAIGYGEQRAVESNDSVEGRARNRRVTILIDALEPEAPPEVLTEITAPPP